MKTPDQHFRITLHHLFAVLVVLASLYIPFRTNGQTSHPDSVICYTKEQQDSLLASPLSPERVWRLLGQSQEHAPYVIVIRTRPGEVEIHEQFDDVIIIRSGHGMLRSGLHAKDQRVSGTEPSREWRDGDIMDAKERKISPGDFIVIPAMTAHQFIPVTGDSLTYWTIKVRRTRGVSH
jgi:mannose-6-phosphate isomerase-like protein (cupin superfamily)